MRKTHILPVIKKTAASKLIDHQHKNVVVVYINIAPDKKFINNRNNEILFTDIIAAVHHYEGIIYRLETSCITALFGTTMRHVDEPERATHAGFEIIRAVESFNAKYYRDVSINVGIHSGKIRFSSITSKKKIRVIHGRHVTKTAEQLAKLGNRSVVVSEGISKKIKRTFRTSKVQQLPLSIKSSRLHPYIVRGEKEKQEPKYGHLSLSAPLIGRNKELGILQMNLDKMKKNRCILFLVQGAAGIGKSRLIDEFRERTEKKVAWLSGRCQSYGKNYPFLVFQEQIRSFAGISSFDQDDGSERKLFGMTQQLCKDRSADSLPYLSIFLSIRVLRHMDRVGKYMDSYNLDPQSLRLQEYISIKKLIKDITKTKPLILYFEDIHWIDSESIDLLAYLISGLQDTSVMFLFETRSENSITRERLAHILSKCHCRMELKPLKDGSAKKLVRCLLPLSNVRNYFVVDITSKAQGNPFYIEELVNMYVESGLLKKPMSSLKTEKGTGLFHVPESIESIIQSRIDQLSSIEKDVLSKASVIGMTFPVCVLNNMNGSKPINEILGILENKDFIKKISVSSSTVKYSFKHGLIQNVVYNGLSSKQRVALHKKAAHCFETIFKNRLDNYYEIIAYHYQQGLNLRKALKYYKKAGDWALSCYSNNTAVSCFTSAIGIHKKIFPDHQRENAGELYSKRGDARVMLAEYEDAIKDYKSAFKNSADTIKKAQQEYKAGRTCFTRGDYENALLYYKKALRMLKTYSASPVFIQILIDYAFLLLVGRDKRNVVELLERTLPKIDKKRQLSLYAHCLNSLANIYRINDHFNKAVIYNKKALAVYRKMKDTKNIALVSNHIGIAYQKMGELNKALEYFKIYYDLSKKIGNINYIFGATNNISLVYTKKADYKSALKYRKRNLKLADEIGYKKTIGFAACCAGNTYYTQNRFRTAFTYFNRYYTISKEISDRRGIGIACLYLGSCCAQIRQYSQAKQYLDQCKEIFKHMAKRKMTDTFVILSQMYTAQNKHTKAQTCAMKAIEVARKVNGKPKEVVALRNMGKIMSSRLPKKAITYLKKSVALADQLNMHCDTAESMYELAKVNKHMKENQSARRIARRALCRFRALGADGWVREVEKFMKTCNE